MGDVGNFRIVLDVTPGKEDVAVSASLRPMIPLMELAKLLRAIADEIEGGRHDFLTIRPVVDD